MADLRGAVELLLEAFEADVPEANCHCHLSPPCGDCVEWAQKREAIAYARGQLEDGDAPFTPETPVGADPPPKCPRCGAHTALVCGSQDCGNRPPTGSRHSA